MNREKEFRTKGKNLLWCKMRCEKAKIFFDLKSGKREDSITLETLIEEVNKFLAEEHLKLDIVTM